MVVVASQVKVAAQRLDPVFKADQSGSATGIGAAHPVVCHRDMHDLLSCVIVTATIGDVATAAIQPPYLLVAICRRVGGVDAPGLPEAEMSCPIRLCANFDQIRC
ncbi:MAG: hypothetical protein QOD59_1722 [Mycobacterium sp.]|jgi:hypothetical protein|nr:hypothetical protein [Mycobacterium sp.]